MLPPPAVPPSPGSKPQLSDLVAWLGLLTLLLGLHACTGRLHLVLVPDSPSYLDYPFDSLPAALRSQRPPGYPVVVRLVDATLGRAALPLVHLLIHAIACGWLVVELARWGTPPVARWAAGLAVALACTSMDHNATLATDALSASVGVLTATALLRWARRRGQVRDVLPVSLLALVAISLRPAYLFLVPWVAIAGTQLLVVARRLPAADATDPWPERLSTVPGMSLAAGWGAIGIALPLVAWIALRGWVVGDPALLPFGHQSLVGLTIQWVSDEELLDTPAPIRELASEILAQRERYLAAGGRFAEGASGATMTIESRWDDYVWHVVVPAADRLHPGDPIVAHHAIRDLNRNLVQRFPGRYLRWLLLATRRAAWGITADLVMHPPFLLAILGVIGWQGYRILAGIAPPTPRVDVGLDALFLVATSYAALKVTLVIATSPPLGRFADAAAIFLPAWLAAVAADRIWRGRRFPAAP